MKRPKTWYLKSLMQILAVAIMFLLFFQIAPWLDAQPISLLPTGVSAPEWAHSFSINHGRYLFLHVGPISEQPILFTISVAILVVCWVFLLWSTRPWVLTSRKKRTWF